MLKESRCQLQNILFQITVHTLFNAFLKVAYEVLRRLAETRGDFALAARMSDFESRKPQIARMILQAQQRGDSALARQLCEELNSLSTLRFDPTNPTGAAGEWDVSMLFTLLFVSCKLWSCVRIGTSGQ